MTRDILFAPLVPLWLIAALGGILAIVAVYGAWRRQSGWWLRGLAAAVVILGLANPSLQSEDRTPLSDIVIAVIDDSASQRIADRPDQTAQALARVRAEVARLPNTELREVTVADAPDNEGTLGMTALAEALGDTPRSRVAGMIMISDGRLHDIGQGPDSLPAPLHLLMTGRDTDWDRRLIVKNAPAYAIIDEEVTLTLRLENQGAVPPGQGDTAPLRISIDGDELREVEVPVGEDLNLPVTLPHGGTNVLQFTVPAVDGELTDRNNSAVVQMNGVRDRLRVLLVSGEPHAGERTWRNLLKSDSSVDLVHFTILRPPEKQDGVPVTELSLIAFPTRELFLEKIDEFDLIIFDRYQRRGILPSIYLDNIRQYVEDGGAVLLAAGPDFAAAASLYRSPLSAVLPGEPTAQVIEEGFHPQVTEIGSRHPVTAGLTEMTTETAAEAAEGGVPPWGRWFRQIEVTPKPAAETVMSGVDDRPLLLLDRIGEGRVALLASDHAWLWNRGFEGGGPQLELLRRLAHWAMKEPELEEEALVATGDGGDLTITRRTLAEGIDDFTVTYPDGSEQAVTPEEVAPGRYTAALDAPGIGLYRIQSGEESAVAVLGPSVPREFAQTIAGTDTMAPVIGPTNGGAVRIEDGAVDLRQVSTGRNAAGRGWLGITPRGAYETAQVTVAPLLPAWSFLALAAALIVGAWLWEGRRRGL